MAAIVKCNGCGRVATARIIEDDPSTNSFECEPEWRDEDHEQDYCVIDDILYWFQVEDVDCKLFKHHPCEHEDFDVTDVENDYDDYS